MDESSAPEEKDQATPIFSAYRRGYDPDQVDRYVADQQRRLDEALQRASEAERRLAAAVGQLRELHRRVAVLESEDRSPQTPALDTLGERVQRILQEAWEGAYALRQGAEQEVGELRVAATAEAEHIVESARNKARAMDEATERRRQAFLERMEEDRNRALAQIAYLHDQRRLALEELVKVRDVIETTVADARFPVPSDAPGVEAGVEAGDEVQELVAEIGPDAFLEEAGGIGLPVDEEAGAPGSESAVPGHPGRLDEQGAATAGTGGDVEAPPAFHEELRPTMPVQHLGIVGDRRQSEHRPDEHRPGEHRPDEHRPGESAGVFDFEAE